MLRVVIVVEAGSADHVKDDQSSPWTALVLPRHVYIHIASPRQSSFRAWACSRPAQTVLGLGTRKLAWCI